MEAARQPVVRVRGLHRWLGEGETRVHVLRGLDIDLEAARTIAVVGPSGCGKSTLLYLLGLLDLPDDGSIHFGERRVDNANEETRTRLRGAEIGFVFQFHFLLAEFTAAENVMLPMLKLGRRSPGEARAAAEDLLDSVGLRGKADRRGNQLSGGEQQRVAVARALANDPRLILADEPTGNLDRGNSEALFGLLRELAREKGQTTLVVTHNPELAARCDQTLSMLDGRFVED
ncbi:MAG: ABC transporter ATP-binding protein [Opitutales bacterium]|nr:ABC transporter ATP-binding protein [Opitutales bacterium]